MLEKKNTDLKEEEFKRPKRSFCPRVINCDPYEGCEHNCVYCVAIDHESDLVVAKENYHDVLRQFLEAGNDRSPVYLGSWTDVYQPAEAGMGLTRKVIELLQSRKHPFFIITKAGGLVTRDSDLFEQDPGNVNLCFSISTCDQSLQKAIEPGAASPQDRLRAIGELSSDIRKVLRLDPLIPGVTTERESMEEVVRRAKEAGVTHVTGEILRLNPQIIANMRQKLGSQFVDNLLRFYSPPEGEDESSEVVSTEQETIIRSLYDLSQRAGITFSTCFKNRSIAPSQGACIGIKFNQI